MITIYKPNLEEFLKEASQIVWVGLLFNETKDGTEGALVLSAFNLEALPVQLYRVLCQNDTMESFRQNDRFKQYKAEVLQLLQSKGLEVREGVLREDNKPIDGALPGLEELETV